MRVRIKRLYRQYRPGDITPDLPRGVAQTMIDNNIAEPVEEEHARKSFDRPPMDRSMRRSAVKVK